MSVIEEWKQCREEVHNFHNFITRIRIHTTIAFIGFLAVAAFVFSTGLQSISLILTILSVPFITFMWFLDNKLSHLMVAVSERSIELENQMRHKKRKEHSIAGKLHNSYGTLPRIQIVTVPLLYLSLMVAGTISVNSILLVTYPWLINLFYICGTLFWVGVMVWFSYSSKLYRKSHAMGGQARI